MLNKLISMDKLQDLVKDEMTVMVSGFMGCGTPHKIVDELIRLAEEETRNIRKTSKIIIADKDNNIFTI